ncbi:hypothetical protein PROSTU_02864 [Providencia stuartii ATCC 25827]|uniref:Uncharacterized protein n=1 Tax=Providencia stuartii ATCC 25827 TaxID=471874 RepID=A0AA87CUI9_PROST|nr:hypothetical protein PROSTU_02864 [Providencia stuartii ATCC 25827]
MLTKPSLFSEGFELISMNNALSGNLKNLPLNDVSSKPWH